METPEVQALTIEAFEQALALAKRGEVQFVAMAVLSKTGCTAFRAGRINDERADAIEEATHHLCRVIIGDAFAKPSHSVDHLKDFVN